MAWTCLNLWKKLSVIFSNAKKKEIDDRLSKLENWVTEMNKDNKALREAILEQRKKFIDKKKQTDKELQTAVEALEKVKKKPTDKELL